MTESLELYDVVTLVKERPELGLSTEDLGTIVLMHKKKGYYEVEFNEILGYDVPLITLHQSDLLKSPLNNYKK